MKEIIVFYFAVTSILLAVMIKLEVQCWLAKREVRKGYSNGMDQGDH